MGWTKGKARLTPEQKAERAVVRRISAAVVAAVESGWPRARLLEMVEQRWSQMEQAG